MTTKHTPGPWATHLVDETVVVIPRRPLPQQISALGLSEVADDEDYANALLIAAAPELLEALSVLYAVAAEQLGDDWAAVTNAAAVIAKARGAQ